MLKNLFKKQKKSENFNNNILIVALLVHAAKIDEKYTEIEKKIIIRTIMQLYKLTFHEAEKLLKLAEKKEEESNQIIEFTSEIKKYAMKFRLKIIEIIWKIVYSDNSSDSYESNLVRKICGLLYVSDKDSGIIKTKIKNTLN